MSFQIRLKGRSLFNGDHGAVPATKEELHVLIVDGRVKVLTILSRAENWPELLGVPKQPSC